MGVLLEVTMIVQGDAPLLGLFEFSLDGEQFTRHLHNRLKCTRWGETRFVYELRER